MKIRQPAHLLQLYKPQENIINSPELRFMRDVCAGMFDTAEEIFSKGRLFSEDPVAIDTPYERFEGMEGVRRFMETWLSTFNAVSSSVIPVFQTRAGGRSVSEIVINFEVDGEINQVPMFIVGDLGVKGYLEEIRMYCHCSFVPGLTPYRKPIFKSAHLEMGDPQLLTGAVREYYEALHKMPHADVDRLLNCMSHDCKFGGYGKFRDRTGEDSHANLRATYERMAGYIPHKVAMRFETIIDDGVTGIIEWVHVISDAGRNDLGRVCLSGIAAYQRGDDGKLCSVRISDYAGLESQIDWTKTPVSKEEAYSINAVDVFPSGVGAKEF